MAAVSRVWRYIRRRYTAPPPPVYPSGIAENKIRRGSHRAHTNLSHFTNHPNCTIFSLSLDSDCTTNSMLFSLWNFRTMRKEMTILSSKNFGAMCGDMTSLTAQYTRCCFQLMFTTSCQQHEYAYAQIRDAVYTASCVQYAERKIQ